MLCLQAGHRDVCSDCPNIYFYNIQDQRGAVSGMLPPTSLSVDHYKRDAVAGMLPLSLSVDHIVAAVARDLFFKSLKQVRIHPSTHLCAQCYVLSSPSLPSPTIAAVSNVLPLSLGLGKGSGDIYRAFSACSSQRPQQQMGRFLFLAWPLLGGLCQPGDRLCVHPSWREAGAAA